MSSGQVPVFAIPCNAPANRSASASPDGEGSPAQPRTFRPVSESVPRTARTFESKRAVNSEPWVLHSRACSANAFSVFCKLFSTFSSDALIVRQLRSRLDRIRTEPVSDSRRFSGIRAEVPARFPVHCFRFIHRLEIRHITRKRLMRKNALPRWQDIARFSDCRLREIDLCRNRHESFRFWIPGGVSGGAGQRKECSIIRQGIGDEGGTAWKCNT